MRIILRQSFPLGRYHATPWKVFSFDDPHGEWPPSPWRLIRAILARSHQWEREGGNVTNESRRILVSAFAASEFAWRLPEQSWRGPGVRQYQPAEFRRVPASAKEQGMMSYNTTKVMDGFWLTSRGTFQDGADAVWWFIDGPEWPSDLLQHLDACLARLTYFGRAESITDIQRIEVSQTMPPEPNSSFQLSRTQGAVPVLGIATNATLEQVEATTDDSTVADATIAPGAIWGFANRAPRPTFRNITRPRPRRPPISLIQFAIGCRVTPRIKDTVRITERFRSRVLNQFLNQETHGSCKTWKDADETLLKQAALLSGKSPDGSALTGHEHITFFIYFDDGKPTRLCAWRPTPFLYEEQEAILGAAELPLPLANGKSPWELQLVPLDRLVPPPPMIPSGKYRIWKTHTPFVPSRHLYDRKGQIKPGESFENQIANELMSRGFGRIPFTVRQLDTYWVKVHHPSRFRMGPPNDDKRGYHLELAFETPQIGPISLGHSSHFGLGLLEPLLV